MYLPTEIKKNIFSLDGNWKYFGNTNRIVSLKKLNKINFYEASFHSLIVIPFALNKKYIIKFDQNIIRLQKPNVFTCWKLVNETWRLIFNYLSAGSIAAKTRRTPEEENITIIVARDF